MRKLARNAPCWCGSGKKYKNCHMRSDMRAAKRGRSRLTSKPDLIKTPEQIEGIRRSGGLTRDILDLLTERIEPGITTEQVDRWVHAYTIEHGATPAPLGYRGFPKSSCTTLNEEICHGIPSERVLQEGDILNVDVTSILDGYYGDSSRMYLIGQVTEEAQRLVRVTQECLGLGIAAVKPGNTIGDIGYAIQQHAEGHGYSVVRDYVGHGTGIAFHEGLQVPHFGQQGVGAELVPGMVFTIEPMINAGGYESRLLDNDWTAVTADGSLSAQWEHTVCVTEDGVDILTA